MKVIALLNYYQENPAWLAECVASTAKLCDHIIAVDGPYAGFPGALRKPYSGSEQADAIIHAAAGAGMGHTHFCLREPWWGDEWGGEVAKRDFMFKLGLTFANAGDWFLRIDADESLAHVPHDARERLAASKHDVAEVTIWTRGDEDYESPFRCLFRAIPGIRIEQTHFTVTAPVNGDRVTLNGLNQVPVAEDLWDVKLEHRTHLRPRERKELKAEYSAKINDFEKAEGIPRGENYERR